MAKKSAKGERKPLLYRSSNAMDQKARHIGGEYRWTRRSADPLLQKKMYPNRYNGRDYTPLFRFLLSHIGDDWTAVYREAASRLDSPDPIFWLVAQCEAERRSYVRVGDASYYSGLYVDDENRLQLVAPDLRAEDMKPFCSCCTHSFNGVRFTLSYDGVGGGWAGSRINSEQD